MSLPEIDLQTIVNGVLILIGAIVGWMVLKAVLRVTARLLAIGCLALVVLAGIGFAVGWVG